MNADEAKSEVQPNGLTRFLTKYEAKSATPNRGLDLIAQLKEAVWQILSSVKTLRNVTTRAMRQR